MDFFKIMDYVDKVITYIIILSIITTSLPILNNYIFQFANYSWLFWLITISGGIAIICSIITKFTKIPPVIIILLVGLLISVIANVYVLVTTSSLDIILSSFSSIGEQLSSTEIGATIVSYIDDAYNMLLETFNIASNNIDTSGI